MTTKFLCGRLVIDKNGFVKEIALKKGGGTRDCKISHIDIGFEEIHDRLREIYSLGQTNSNSKLYDFKLNELDTSRYTSFYDYVQQNGLKFKGTLLYLCTSENGGNTVNPRPLKGRRTTTTTTQAIQNPGPVIRRTAQAEPDSSTPPIVNQKILGDQRVDNKTTHRHSTSDPSTNYLMDLATSTSFSSSLSSQYHSERDSRKRTRHLSPSSLKSTEDNNNEKFSLFKNLLKSLDRLLAALYQRRFMSFYSFLRELIDETESCRSTIKISDYQSLYDAEQIIISIESRVKNRINLERNRATPYGITPQLEYSFKTTLDSFQHVLKSFHHYKSQIDKHKRLRTIHKASPIEEKPIINKSIQEKTKIDDDDQSSESSHSSVGDEVLMEVAKDAYEQRSNQDK